MPMAKATAPRLYDFMLRSLEREDEMHIDYAYKTLLAYHDWHDLPTVNKKAPFAMPTSTKAGVTTAEATLVD